MDRAERQANAPAQLAADFLRAYQHTGDYERDAIAYLVQQALSERPEEAQAVTTAIFAELVEKLADAFEPNYVSLYNRLFAQLIHLCRATPQGVALDRELTQFGLPTEAALITRAEQLRYVHRFQRNQEAKARIKRVLVLSRVTIGADVAITSVIIERLKREFPAAEIVLIGNRKAAELFGGEARISFFDIDYRRGGTLIERLASWLNVLAKVREITEDLYPDEWLIIDPDSRLTQLGLLPLVEVTGYRGGGTGNKEERLEERKRRKGEESGKFSTPNSELRTPNSQTQQHFDQYLFFPSREIGGNSGHSLAELTSFWLNAIFGDEEQTFPQLSLRLEDCQLAKSLLGKIRQGDTHPLISLNFGVGDNQKKRVSDEFESQLVAHLLQSGARLILDKGAGAEETQRAERVIRMAIESTHRNQQFSVVEANEETLPSLLATDGLQADVLVWQGRIGLLAAMIAESDLYIGYDSAGQHIAAALAVPCIDVFAGYSSPRMLQRWRPTGRAASSVIAVDTVNGVVDERAILAETLERAQAYLQLKK